MKTNIVHKLKSNDQTICLAGLEELYNQYYKLVYFCIVGIVNNPQDTEELVNDVFLRIWNNRLNLQEDKNIKYYLTTIAKNISIDFLRKRKLNVEYNDDYIMSYVNPTNSDNPTFNELIDMLSDYLTDEEINIIIYHFLYNETFENIAKKLNKNPNTIRTTYFRSLKKVKKWKKMNVN